MQESHCPSKSENISVIVRVSTRMEYSTFTVKTLFIITVIKQYPCEVFFVFFDGRCGSSFVALKWRISNKRHVGRRDCEAVS